MPRTGTVSIKTALELLGFGKCYHMRDLIENAEHLGYFQNADKNSYADWEEVFKGYKSICIVITNESRESAIIRSYPNAKIIHSIREPETWFQSASDTVFQPKLSIKQAIKLFYNFAFSPKLILQLKVMLFSRKNLKKLFGTNLKDKQKIVGAYTKYNEDVETKMQSRQFLLYTVKDGWEPLCNFLNVPIPNVPFPMKNSRDEFIESSTGISKNH